MSSIHTFIDMDNLPNQFASYAYGPIQGEETTKYRVTGKFKLQNDSMAYAMTDGIVMIQTIPNHPNLVSLVLKPNRSALSDLGSIECIIYRGLVKSDFVDNDDNIISQTNSTSDYINQIWADFTALVDANLSSGGRPSELRLGIDFDTKDKEMLLSLAMSKVRTAQGGGGAITLHSVSKGASLGRFTHQTDIGIEIILRDKHYKPTLDTLRKLDNIIEVDSPNGQIAGQQPKDEMRKREQILNFVDPAVFFASFHNVGIIYKTTTETKNIKGFDEIYDKIVKKFYTKNTFYFDMRNEFGHSINFYRDYEGDASASNHSGNTSAVADEHIIYELHTSGVYTSQNYYQNFWPITSFNLSNGFNHFQVCFRKRYNSEPLVYIDSGLQSPSVIDKFEYYDMAFSIDSDYWSSFFLLPIPTLSNVQNNPGISWLFRIIVCRKVVEHSLPPTVLPRQNYLDHLFGPIHTDIDTTSNHILFDVDLGKRYINSEDYGNLIVETSMLYSSKHVGFMVNVLDRYVKGSEDEILPLGTNNKFDWNSSSVIEKLKETLNVDIGIETIDDDGETVETVQFFSRSQLSDTKVNLENNEEGLLFGLIMDKTEFENQLLPAALSLDTSLHEVYINPTNVVIKNETKQVATYQNQIGTDTEFKYMHCFLKVSGFDSGGLYQFTAPYNGEIKAFSLDGYFFFTDDAVKNFDGPKNETTDIDAYIEVDDFIEYVRSVEEIEEFFELGLFISDWGVWDKISNKRNKVISTSTRIRVHSYGFSKKRKDFLFFIEQSYYVSIAFNNAIPDAPYTAFGGDVLRALIPPNKLSNSAQKKFEEWEFPDFELVKEDYKKAYKHLTSHADEKGFQSNRSPYILIPTPNNQNTHNEADMGQILYGFESLVLPRIGSGYNQYYNIDNNYDLTAIIANIATPIAEMLVHEDTGRSPQRGLNKVITPNLIEYYDISAPEADLYANADAIGLYNAYQRIKDNDSLMLSDILDLYYNNNNSFPIQNTNIENFTVDKRWLILAEHFNLIYSINGNYIWLPETNDWQNYNPNSYKNKPDSSTTNYENYKHSFYARMYFFSVYWYNMVYSDETLDKLYPGYISAKNKTLLPSFIGNQKIVPDEADTIHYIGIVCENYFFPYVKQQIISTNPTMSIL